MENAANVPLAFVGGVQVHVWPGARRLSPSVTSVPPWRSSPLLTAVTRKLIVSLSGSASLAAAASAAYVIANAVSSLAPASAATAVIVGGKFPAPGPAEAAIHEAGPPPQALSAVRCSASPSPSAEAGQSPSSSYVTRSTRIYGVKAGSSTGGSSGLYRPTVSPALFSAPAQPPTIETPATRPVTPWADSNAASATGSVGSKSTTSSVPPAGIVVPAGKSNVTPSPSVHGAFSVASCRVLSL